MFGITDRIDRFVGNIVNPNNGVHTNPMQQRDNIVNSIFAQSGMPFPNLQSTLIPPYPPIYAANNEQLLFNEISSHLQHMGFTGNLQNREQDIFSVVKDVLRNKGIQEHNIIAMANNITAQYLQQQFLRTQQTQYNYLPNPTSNPFSFSSLTQPHNLYSSIQNILPFPYSPNLGIDQNYQNLVEFYKPQVQSEVLNMPQSGMTDPQIRMSDAQIASMLNKQSRRANNQRHETAQLGANFTEQMRRQNMYRPNHYRYHSHSSDGGGVEEFPQEY
jgi:hypothetical protein